MEKHVLFLRHVIHQIFHRKTEPSLLKPAMFHRTEDILQPLPCTCAMSYPKSTFRSFCCFSGGSIAHRGPPYAVVASWSGVSSSHEQAMHNKTHACQNVLISGLVDTVVVLSGKNKSHPLARGLGWRSCGLPVVHQWIFSSRRHPRAPIGFWYRAPSSSRQLGFGVQQLKDSGSVGDQSLQVHTALT